MALSNAHTVSLRDALEVVPYYDGSNIPFSHFSRSCNEAKLMLPFEAELNLTKLIKTRLLGEPRRAIEYCSFDKISDLLLYLRRIFANTKTLSQLQGELGNVLQNNSESVISYANRIKDLGREIKETYELNNNSKINSSFEISIEKEMITCFTNGLLPEIERRMKIYNNIDEAIQEAINIEKKLSTISLIRQEDEINNLNDREEFTSKLENCQICSKEGHSAINCHFRYRENSSNNSEFEVITCHICNKRNHVASECRFRKYRKTEERSVKRIKENFMTCQMCNGYGHTADKCWQSQRSRTLTRIENESCQLCHQYGHTADRCHKSPPLTFCQICKKPGHSAEKCFKIQLNNSIVKPSFCESYEQFDHTTEMCFNRNLTPFSFSEEVAKCKHCKELGHVIENCTRKETAGQNKPNQENITRPMKSLNRNYKVSTIKIKNESLRKTKEENILQGDSSIVNGNPPKPKTLNKQNEDYVNVPKNSITNVETYKGNKECSNDTENINRITKVKNLIIENAESKEQLKGKCQGFVEGKINLNTKVETINGINPEIKLLNKNQIARTKIMNDDSQQRTKEENIIQCDTIIAKEYSLKSETLSKENKNYFNAHKNVLTNCETSQKSREGVNNVINKQKISQNEDLSKKENIKYEEKSKEIQDFAEENLNERIDLEKNIDDQLKLPNKKDKTNVRIINNETRRKSDKENLIKRDANIIKECLLNANSLNIENKVCFDVPKTSLTTLETFNKNKNLLIDMGNMQKNSQVMKLNKEKDKESEIKLEEELKDFVEENIDLNSKFEGKINCCTQSEPPETPFVIRDDMNLQPGILCHESPIQSGHPETSIQLGDVMKSHQDVQNHGVFKIEMNNNCLILQEEIYDQGDIQENRDDEYYKKINEKEKGIESYSDSILLSKINSNDSMSQTEFQEENKVNTEFNKNYTNYQEICEINNVKNNQGCYNNNNRNININHDDIRNKINSMLLIGNLIDGKMNTLKARNKSSPHVRFKERNKCHNEMSINFIKFNNQNCLSTHTQRNQSYFTFNGNFYKNLNYILSKFTSIFLLRDVGYHQNEINRINNKSSPHVRFKESNICNNEMSRNVIQFNNQICLPNQRQRIQSYFTFNGNFYKNLNYILNKFTSIFLLKDIGYHQNEINKLHNKSSPHVRFKERKKYNDEMNRNFICSPNSTQRNQNYFTFNGKFYQNLNDILSKFTPTFLLEGNNYHQNKFNRINNKSSPHVRFKERKKCYNETNKHFIKFNNEISLQNHLQRNRNYFIFNQYNMYKSENSILNKFISLFSLEIIGDHKTKTNSKQNKSSPYVKFKKMYKPEFEINENIKILLNICKRNHNEESKLYCNPCSKVNKNQIQLSNKLNSFLLLGIRTKESFETIDNNDMHSQHGNSKFEPLLLEPKRSKTDIANDGQNLCTNKDKSLSVNEVLDRRWGLNRNKETVQVETNVKGSDTHGGEKENTFIYDYTSSVQNKEVVQNVYGYKICKYNASYLIKNHSDNSEKQLKKLKNQKGLIRLSKQIYTLYFFPLACILYFLRISSFYYYKTVSKICV